MSEVIPERVEMLWEGRIPLGYVTVLGGYGGTGKSSLVTHLAARVTRGTLEGDLYGTPSGVLIYSPEDSPQGVIRPRCEVNGADLNKLCLLEPAKLLGPAKDNDGEYVETVLHLPLFTSRLEEVIGETGARLVILDPASRSLQGDNDNAQDVQAMLDALNQVARRTGAAIVCVVHTRKSGGQVTQALAGSAQWYNAARAVLMVAGAEEYSVVQATKFNAGVMDDTPLKFSFTNTLVGGENSPAAARITIEGPSPVDVETLINRQVLSEDEKEERQGLDDFLRSFLQSGEWTPTKTIYKAAREEFGTSSTTVWRALKRIGAQSKQVDFPARGVWRLPGGSECTELTGKDNESIRRDTATSPVLSQLFQTEENETTGKHWENGPNTPKSRGENPSGFSPSFSPGPASALDECPIHKVPLSAAQACSECLKKEGAGRGNV
ncbi:AAA family ATPase [Actinobaculum suis]|nr:AAA family ATPase [Actinobaculum suis]MDY5152588.1 AAA family ATPase [Actinobaculum suis]